MNCLNCGCKTDNFLCGNCINLEILDKIFNEVLRFKPDECDNTYLKEYVAQQPEDFKAKFIIPELLGLFDQDGTEYYRCKYMIWCHSEDAEESAIKYIEGHTINEMKTMDVLYYLIKDYISKDYAKYGEWCELIRSNNNLGCELYLQAAECYAKIGDYDLSDELIDKCETVNAGSNPNRYILDTSDAEEIDKRIADQKRLTLRYRSGNPYWPMTEEARRKLAVIYDAKGISHNRIELKPRKVPESEFAGYKECIDTPEDYCAFWCSSVSNGRGIKDVYQIAAVKVKAGEIVATYESLIKPWDSQRTVKAAAKVLGIPTEEMNYASDVDLVMPKFFHFTGNLPLVSTDALAEQWKLLSRATRYSGMTEIKNEMLELLDLASDTDDEFDDNNNRAYLLNFFKIEEGETALDKAKANKSLYEALLNYGK